MKHPAETTNFLLCVTVIAAFIVAMGLLLILEG